MHLRHFSQLAVISAFFLSIPLAQAGPLHDFLSTKGVRVLAIDPSKNYIISPVEPVFVRTNDPNHHAFGSTVRNAVADLLSKKYPGRDPLEGISPEFLEILNSLVFKDIDFQLYDAGSGENPMKLVVGTSKDTSFVIEAPTFEELQQKVLDPKFLERF
jgi:hypothetical protein